MLKTKPKTRIRNDAVRCGYRPPLVDPRDEKIKTPNMSVSVRIYRCKRNFCAAEPDAMRCRTKYGQEGKVYSKDVLFYSRSIKLFLLRTFFFMVRTGSTLAGAGASSSSRKSRSWSMGSRSAAPRGTSFGPEVLLRASRAVFPIVGTEGISGDGPRTEVGLDAREFRRRRSLGEENMEVEGAVCGVMGV